jgi:hypothetical protein
VFQIIFLAAEETAQHAVWAGNKVQVFDVTPFEDQLMEWR